MVGAPRAEVAVLGGWVGKAGDGEAQRMLQVWEVSVCTWLRGDGAGKEMDLCLQDGVREEL